MSLHWKLPVRVVADYHIDLSLPPDDIDAVPLEPKNRILCTCQNDPKQNGVWVYLGPKQHLLRADDFFHGHSVENTAMVVQEGSKYSDVCFVQVNEGVVVGEPLQFTMLAGADADAFVVEDFAQIGVLLDSLDANIEKIVTATQDGQRPKISNAKIEEIVSAVEHLEEVFPDYLSRFRKHMETLQAAAVEAEVFARKGV